MALDKLILEEIELLNLFNLNSTQEGLKIHNDASPQAIAAAERLFHKGIVSQIDGGYLTDRGVETAEHVQHLVTMLRGH
ncbi:MAG: TIGR02647 family protein [Kangiellaceae bacterium]|nr:TIGR02647 family protein [Kangiellaceae bacterium]